MKEPRRRDLTQKRAGGSKGDREKGQPLASASNRERGRGRGEGVLIASWSRCGGEEWREPSAATYRLVGHQTQASGTRALPRDAASDGRDSYSGRVSERRIRNVILTLFFDGATPL
ncbi:hypothetical protein BHE74_00014294 [Ensete ventricosum]|nr:hypothetical protein BHE74_00014294 [Ensete ventricosum]